MSLFSPALSNERDIMTIAYNGALVFAIVAITVFAHADEVGGASVSVRNVSTNAAGRASILDRYGRDESGNLSLLKKHRSSEKASVDKSKPKEEDPGLVLLRSLSDDTEFLRVGEYDGLSWGALHNEADTLLETKLGLLLAAGAATQMDAVRLDLYKQSISKLAQRYIKASVIAIEARKAGIKVPDSEMAAKISEAMARGRTKVLSTYQAQYITNAVYQQIYIDKFLRPKLRPSNDDIDKLIAKRHEMNLSVPATNAIFRARAEEVRRRLVNKEISFSEAVEEYSECPQCASDDGDCGTWDEDDEGIDNELRKACFSMPTNVISGVIETTNAFHIVKITGKYVPSKKAREDDGEVSSVDVSHIQIDKWTVDPEFTKETAAEFIVTKLLSRALKVKQFELIKSTPIQCVIPISDKKGRGTVRVFN